MTKVFLERPYKHFNENGDFWMYYLHFIPLLIQCS